VRGPRVVRDKLAINSNTLIHRRESTLCIRDVHLFVLNRLDDDLFKPKSSSKTTDTFTSEWEVIDRKTPTKEYGSSGSNNSYSSNYGSSTANSGGYRYSRTVR
jgi:hypothetical protein